MAVPTSFGVARRRTTVVVQVVSVIALLTTLNNSVAAQGLRMMGLKDWVGWLGDARRISILPGSCCREVGRRARADSQRHAAAPWLVHGSIVGVRHWVADNDGLELDAAFAGGRLDGEVKGPLGAASLCAEQTCKLVPRDDDAVHVVALGRILSVVLQEQVAQMLAILTRQQLEVVVAVRPFLVLLHVFRVFISDHINLLSNVGLLIGHSARDGCLSADPRERVNRVQRVASWNGGKGNIDHHILCRGAH
mmetsp:Transcript_20732/g.69256  ORF Transcript_20732/g.69256 Transcript_20732/m.69256 type:complete len:250 (-) Transcript_20732:634-1383(-)